MRGLATQPPQLVEHSGLLESCGRQPGDGATSPSTARDPTWHGSPQQLKRCLSNLVDNAVLYGQRAGDSRRGSVRPIDAARPRTTVRHSGRRAREGLRASIARGSRKPRHGRHGAACPSPQHWQAHGAPSPAQSRGRGWKRPPRCRGAGARTPRHAYARPSRPALCTPSPYRSGAGC